MITQEGGKKKKMERKFKYLNIEKNIFLPSFTTRTYGVLRRPRGE